MTAMVYPHHALVRVLLTTAPMRRTPMLLLCACSGRAPASVATLPTPVVETRPEVSTSGDGVRYLTHEVIVQRAPDVIAADFEAAVHAIGGVLVDTDSPATVRLGFERILLPVSITADEAISKLMEAGVVSYAARNHLLEIESHRLPNDAMWPDRLWGLQKIHAPDAWDLTIGSRDVVVAVIDSGIDHRHPDLALNIWNNDGEIPGNGQDDDGNGLVDDTQGWDFGLGQSDPMDDLGHGTHVAGTVGAVGDNGVGVVGVNWNVQIINLKISAYGYLSMWAGTQSVVYATAKRARVINASWGCFGSCWDQPLYNAIDEFRKIGGIFIAAAGNKGENNDVQGAIPANFPLANIVSVAAMQGSLTSDAYDKLTDFSNYGVANVDLAAPGLQIWSTVPGGYDMYAGTSMAAPHVAGAAALYFAYRPAADYNAVKQRMLAHCQVRGSMVGKVGCGGFLNVRALLTTDDVPPPAPLGFIVTAGSRNDLHAEWQSPAPDVASYKLEYGTESGLYTFASTLPRDATTFELTDVMAGTTYFFRIRAFDEAGNEGAISDEQFATAQDLSAPAQVLDLVAAPFEGSVLTASVSGASSQLSDYWRAERAADGDPATAWVSAGRASDTGEFVTVELSESTSLGSVEIAPNIAYPQYFPVDLDLDVSPDGVAWEPAAGLRDMAIPNGTVTVHLSPNPVRAVRLRAVRTRQHTAGVYYASIGELSLRRASSQPNALKVTFTAPGDDPGSGAAQSYDMRYSTTPLSAESFEAAPRAMLGATAPSGIIEEVTLADLQPETAYFVAMRASDEAGNVSPISNIAQARTLVVPPAAIVDLRAALVTESSVSLIWTAPGDNGTVGQAARYELRMAPTALDATQFQDGEEVTAVPVPGPAGSIETLSIGGLAGPGMFFAVRAQDAAGHFGPISNVLWVRLLQGPDVQPPAAIDDLQAFASLFDELLPVRAVSATSSDRSVIGAITDGNLLSAWTAQAGPPDSVLDVVLDVGSVRAVRRLRAHPATGVSTLRLFPRDFAIEASADGVAWTPLAHIEGVVAEWAAWYEWAFESTFTRYLRLHVTRRGPGACTIADACGQDHVAVSLAEVEAYGPALDSYAADLTWTAPGDDDWLGAAAQYDGRMSFSLIDELSFGAATPIALGAPAWAGFLEVARVSGLALETEYFFALRATDDAGNDAALSNVARIMSSAIAPAPVVDLRMTDAGKTDLMLAWTATGDDGNQGTATAYDFRYAFMPLSEQGWEFAERVVEVPAPLPAGSAESFRVTGLPPSSVLYFACKVIDDQGRESIISNILRAETEDGVAPAAITDFAIAHVEPWEDPPLALSVDSASSAFDPTTAAANLVDGDVTTHWISAGKTISGQDEWVVLNLPYPTKLGRLRLRAEGNAQALFPNVFRVEARYALNDAWAELLSEDAGAGQEWQEWSLGGGGGVEASQVRLTMHADTVWYGMWRAGLSEVELYRDALDYDKVRLSWTATGDDATAGAAVQYEIRVGATPLDEASFGAAAQVTQTMTPRPAGYPEELVVPLLLAETGYCFALRAKDDADNAGLVSNSACLTTYGPPPATISDLRIDMVGADQVVLAWTTPGGDGTLGQCAGYELRYDTARITSETWGTASMFPQALQPGQAGTQASLLVSGLARVTEYFFAVRAADHTGNESGISNNAWSTTLDDYPPAPVADLSARTHVGYAGSIDVLFISPVDNGPSGRAASYELRYATTPITGDTFAAAARATTGTPLAAGVPETIQVSGLVEETAYYFALKSADSSGSISSISNIASAWTNERAPSMALSFSVVSQSGGNGPASVEATIQWTAPGDDATTGTAARYDLRRSTALLTDANFAAAQSVTAPTPSVAGSTETARAGGLEPDQQYSLGLITYDERGNRSPLVTTVFTAQDAWAPGVVSDLAASTGTYIGQIRLTWSAPGENGNSGRATTYDVRYGAAPITTDAAFAAASALTSLPTPLPPTSAQSYTAAGLAHESEFYFAIKTKDSSNNWSALSNSPSARTKEVPPATILDLRQTASGRTSITLAWTAPGADQMTGTAAAYDVRISTSVIDDSNFASATSVNAPQPATAGTVESLTINALSRNTVYSVGIKTRDQHNNWSDLSVLRNAATLDEEPPAQIDDLVAETANAAGGITLTWTSVGDDGNTGSATRYEVRHALSEITNQTWAGASVVRQSLTPRASGLIEVYTVWSLQGETPYHFAVRAVDDQSNMGELSLPASAETLPIAPNPIADLRAEAVAGGVRLTWTAVGDDGSSGTAARYDVRRSLATITLANFGAATSVAGAPTPLVSGTAQSMTASSLSQSTRYFFVVKVIDDHNQGTLSNGVWVTTLDETAPAAVSGLTVTQGDTRGTIRATFGAPGDDGGTGTAHHYELRTSVRAIDAGNFAEGQPATAPTPLASGQSQTVTIGQLADESLVYMAIRAVDEAGNIGALAFGSATTRTVPPAAVTSLLATQTQTGIRLTWTAVGNNGLDGGPASAYDLRYSTQSIDASTFATATILGGLGAPAAPGVAESFDVEGLPYSTTFWFALRVTDQIGAQSDLSNVVSATTPDRVAPAAPGSMFASTAGGTRLALEPQAVTASSELDARWAAGQAADLDAQSSWVSAGTEGQTTQSLALDFGSASLVDRIRLTPDGLYASLFPSTFSLELSEDGQSWNEVASERDFAPEGAASLAWGFDALSARYARLSSFESGESYGRHYTVIAEMAVDEAAPTDGQITLSWVAPGDDDGAGTAERYEIFFSTQAFDSGTLGGATRWSPAPAPQAAGALQSATITGLQGETRYSVALRAIDDAGNVGPLSSVVSVVTNAVAPSPVADLIARTLGPSDVVLSWTAPGDDGTSGNATSYDLRRSLSAITSENFADATLVPTGAPAASGAAETKAVSGLEPGTTYRFALVTRDEAGTASSLSNVAVVVMPAGPDHTAPAAIIDLTVQAAGAGGSQAPSAVVSWSNEAPDFPAGLVADGSTASFWSTEAQHQSSAQFVRLALDDLAQVDTIRLHPAAGFLGLFPPTLRVRISPDGLSWTEVASYTGYISATAEPLDVSFATSGVAFVELAIDALARHGNGFYYAVVAELEAIRAPAPSGTVIVSWTATGDDGTSGVAAFWDLRVGSCPYDHTQALQIATPAPSRAGSPERVTVTGLSPGTQCLGVVVHDEAANESALSNVAEVVVR